ncbi:phytanoyl-CoA dioxygenase family protein [Paraburkholderia domus]|uniref:phytanoyl-CoA dioxygenase family protein n=1 Tax=Paraburkholderia domus TaxID=2793075 RepID=UPI001B2E5507|nr:phytanoyl-CoA dioxygenase family protein [Paraburkholderia domus]CAE6851395.1 hypothetical protein R75483_07616 [Paraburkholderia domus]
MTLSEQLERDGYALMPGAVPYDQVRRLRTAFDLLWKRHDRSVDQRQLLAVPEFIELIDHPRLLDELTTVFGDQLQLIMYALRNHDAGDDLRERDWHRDFSFVCDRVIAVNAILYLDDTADSGPTVAVPGSHRWRTPPAERFEPRSDEVPLPAKAGDILLNDATLWHSRSRNKTLSPRRLVLLYFGYWWLKRYEHDSPLPRQALESASARRLQLLGVRMPGRDLHLYELGDGGDQ